VITDSGGITEETTVLGVPCLTLRDTTERPETVTVGTNELVGTDPTNLARRMVQAAERMQFERAAMYRDQIKAAQRLVEQQQVISHTLVDQDVIALASDENGDETAFQVFLVRRGKLIGRESFVLPHTGDDDRAELLATFLSQFYDQVSLIPPEVVLPLPPADGEVIAQWLTEKRRAHVAEDDDPAVRLTQPTDEESTKAMALAESNAFEALRTLRAVREADKSKQVLSTQELQNALGLETPPGRIECFDISHFQGSDTYASCVVFLDGRPAKEEYRAFRIDRPVPDDFASIAEAVTRRYERRLAEGGALPDLLVIDGGKGQLSAALGALDRIGVELPAVGLAKREEEVLDALDALLDVALALGVRLAVLVADEPAELVEVALHADDPLISSEGLGLTLAAIEALGAIHPKDLGSKLSSLLAADVKEGVRNATRRAVGGSGTCGGKN